MPTPEADVVHPSLVLEEQGSYDFKSPSKTDRSTDGGSIFQKSEICSSVLVKIIVPILSNIVRVH